MAGSHSGGPPSRNTISATPSPRSESRLTRSRASTSRPCAGFSKVAPIDTNLVRSIDSSDWAVHEDRITVNPCSSIARAYRPAAGGKRERTPTLKELALIWRAAETALEPVFRDLIRFAICDSGSSR